MLKTYITASLLFFLTFTCLAGVRAANNDAISIEEALSSPDLQMSFASTGVSAEYAIQVEVSSRMHFDLSITVPAGALFDVEEEAYQDILITKTTNFVVRANQRATALLYGFCFEAGKFPSPEGEPFKLVSNGIPEIDALANHLDAHEYTPHAQQEAIWSITNDFNLAGIIGKTPDKTSALRYFCGGLLNKEIPWYSIHYENILNRPFENNMKKLSGVMTFSVEEECVGSLILRNPEGDFLISIFEDRKLFPGAYTQDFEFSATQLDPGDYQFQIIVDGLVLEERQISF